MNLYLLLFIVTIGCFGLQFEPLNQLTAWQLTSIQDGQWWRIVTGNFTHTNFTHLAMNLLGLWVISYFFKPTARSLSILLVSISTLVGISLLATSLHSYVGLSGTLHGIFAFYSLNEALNGRKSSWLLVIGVIAKVLSEQWLGASTSTAELIQARVAIEAHLSGLIFGLLLCLANAVKTYAGKRSTG